MRPFIFAFTLLALAGADPARAAESYDGCKYTIASLPAVLSSQGVWCMKSDLSTSLATGTAITVAVNNVTIDCNHFKLGGLGAGTATQATGIDASSRGNTTVRNCTIRGFSQGVVANSGYGTVVEDNLLEANRNYAIWATAADGTVVRGNRIVDTGGSSYYDWPNAISVSGDAHVIDNIVSGVADDGAADDGVHAIYVTDASGTITGNRISGLVADGTGAAYAIRTGGTDRAVIDGNFVKGSGAANSFGIHCASDLNLARNNVVLGMPWGVLGCTSAGNHVDTD
jgi:hypothetical protein